MLTPGWMTQKLLIASGYKAEEENRSVQKEKLERQVEKNTEHSAFGCRRQALRTGILLKGSRTGFSLPTCELSGPPTHLLLNEDNIYVYVILFFKNFALSSEPAPPKSLFAVNKTQTSVTLLWVEEGVADFFEVLCQQLGSSHDAKLQVLIASTFLLGFFWLRLMKQTKDFLFHESTRSENCLLFL